MSIIIDSFTILAMLVGTGFMVIGGIGLLRMPDFYTRMHAAGLIDTLGAGFILVGLMLQGGLTLVSAKLFLILILMWLTGPTAGHALVRAALSDPNQPRPLLQTSIKPTA